MPLNIDTTVSNIATSILATNIKTSLAIPNAFGAEMSPNVSWRLERASGPDFKSSRRPTSSRFSLLPIIAFQILSRGAITLPRDSKGSTSDKLVFWNFEVI